MIKRFGSFILFLPIVHALFSGAVQAANCTLTALQSLLQPSHDSSVEMELHTKQAIHLLTTRNGKVGGLLKYEEQLPGWFQEWASLKFPGKQPADIPWDSLHETTKMKLLRDVSKNRNQKFFSDRTFYGLRPKSEVTLKFNKTTTFLGHQYRPGKNKVDLSSMLGSKVEYRGPLEVETGSGIELHFRGNQSAGQMSNDAWTLLDGMGIPRSHQHIHVVAKLPVEALKSEPILQTALMADFFRRANLTAEMVDIIQDGGRILSNRQGRIVYFDSLTPKNLEGVAQYFLDLGHGEHPSIGDSFKIGWVGMRGSDKYDSKGLWGIEVRSIGKKSNPRTYKNFLDGLQHTMHTETYGLPKEQMKEWLNAQPKGKAVTKKIRDTWYHQDWITLLLDAPKEIKSKMGGISGWMQRMQLIPISKRNRELKMLIHDWSNDPLIFNNTALKEKIIVEQVKALERVLKKKEEINVVMSEFLVDSGLYSEFLNSVGVAVKQ